MGSNPTSVIMILFLQKYMINGMILILILLIFRSLMAMSLDVPLIVYIYIQLIRFARASLHVTDFNNGNKFLREADCKHRALVH